jgi:hypothetical protein
MDYLAGEASPDEALEARDRGLNIRDTLPLDSAAQVGMPNTSH